MRSMAQILGTTQPDGFCISRLARTPKLGSI